MLNSTKIRFKLKSICLKMELNPLQQAQAYVEHFHARMWKYYNSFFCFLVLHGLTKASKSTIATLRSGRICISYKTQTGEIKIKYKKQIRVKKLEEDEFDIIGNQIESCTIVPNFVDDCLDLPGVADSRTLVIGLINAYMKFICLTGNKNFKFVILVHESGLSQPGTDFITTIKTFFQNFAKLKQNMDKILSATALIISKGDKNIQDIRKTIKNYAQLRPAQMKGYFQQYREFLTRLIQQDRIFTFNKPGSPEKIIEDKLTKEIESRIKPIAFQQGEIASSIAVEIKESLSNAAKKLEFEGYINHLVNTIDVTICQGLNILAQLVLNVLNNPNNLFADQDQDAYKQITFKQRLVNFVEKHEKSLMNEKAPDYLARHNLLRDIFHLEHVKDKKEVNSFREVKNQKAEGTVSSNCAQYLLCENLKIILQIIDRNQFQQNENSTYQKACQKTNKLKQKIISIMGRLWKVMQKENMMYFFRFCYALKNKIEWVMAGMIMLSGSSDNEIKNQFGKIGLRNKIKDALDVLVTNIQRFFQKKIDNFKIISHEQSLSVHEILIRYYTLQIKPNENSDPHYLSFNLERLDDLLLKTQQKDTSWLGSLYQDNEIIPKSQWANWQINLIKKRKAQNLAILAKKSLEGGRLRSAAYYASQSILYSQQITDDEARKIAIKSRSLLGKTIETAIKQYNYKKSEKKLNNVKNTVKIQQAMIQSKVLEDAIQSGLINLDDCAEIFKANNQINQELRILEEQLTKNQELEIGKKLIKRLFECLKKQKALQIGQKVYEALGDDLEKKKEINKLILDQLQEANDKLAKFKQNIKNRQNYKCLNQDFLKKFELSINKQTSESSSTD